MFPDKFNQHEHKDEILKRFDEGATVKDIEDWLETLGEEFKLSNDTIRRHKRRHDEGNAVKKEVNKAKEEFGEVTDVESYLLETIAQCRARKKGTTISGKDYQYYDQQMQNAIKILNEARSGGEKSIGLDEVFDRLADSIINEDKPNS